ncbi:MAG: fused N-dimethylarginine dimethylaminohydrolase/saccharopine dehydrogenase domain-containing protein, partial [Nitrospinae bacterium]|nr:fused N-dimethylarginine dimethylaminohydrolase/saccharopine dehydrogenase domain-containing protein [Nitrospinota bacterium]
MPYRLLMCPPDHFEVRYSINPWMRNQVNRVDLAHARKQWDDFFKALEPKAEIQLLKPQSHTPDLVFTANAGAVRGNRVVLSRFRYKERQAEEPFFREWFSEHGYEIIELDESIRFEGAGDALFQPDRNWLWAGYGFRTDREAHAALGRKLDVTVISLRLTDPRFYHLDTCFCPLPDDCAMYYPPAFDEESLSRIESRIKPENRIVVPAADAMNFACNAVLVGQTLYLNPASKKLQARPEGTGLSVCIQPDTEFMKAGGP